VGSLDREKKDMRQQQRVENQDDGGGKRGKGVYGGVTGPPGNLEKTRE